MLNFRETL